MNRRKITFIGGGSSKFIREVVVDLFTYPGLEDSHIELMDVDAERALLTLPQIRAMVDEMFVPNQEYLREWK
jgi:alpha-galactosidase/6-phospho-beta-glucosidase family protein